MGAEVAGTGAGGSSGPSYGAGVLVRGTATPGLARWRGVSSRPRGGPGGREGLRGPGGLGVGEPLGPGAGRRPRRRGIALGPPGFLAAGRRGSSFICLLCKQRSRIGQTQLYFLGSRTAQISSTFSVPSRASETPAAHLPKIASGPFHQDALINLGVLSFPVSGIFMGCVCLM